MHKITFLNIAFVTTLVVMGNVSSVKSDTKCYGYQKYQEGKCKSKVGSLGHFKTADDCKKSCEEGKSYLCKDFAPYSQPIKAVKLGDTCLALD